MTFGRPPHHAGSSGFGPVPATDGRFDAPYADGRADGFGGRSPAPDGFGPPAPLRAGPGAAAPAAGVATSAAAALVLAPASLALPPTLIGTSSQVTASLANDSGEELAVDSVSVSNPAFSADLVGSNAIGPGDRVAIDIRFAPTPPMIGSQHATLTVTLQNGTQLTSSITGVAEMPGAAPPSAAQPEAAQPAAPTSPKLDLDALGRAGAPGLCRPADLTDRCDADNHGQARVGAIRASRVHNPGTTGEFRDPLATTLYPHDLLEITVDVAGSKADFGRIEDSAGLLATRRAERRGDTIVLVAEAKRLGATFAHLTILADGDDLARLPFGELSVVAVLGDDDDTADQSQRIKSTDIDDALSQLRIATRSIFAAQKRGVTSAKGHLLQQPTEPKTPWYTELFTLGAEAAISFVSAGVGNRLGRAVAKWSAGVRDLDLGKIPVFDLESAFGTSMKDSLKHLARDHLLAGGRADGMTVDEQWAIDLFCTAQIDALERVSLDLEGELNNGAHVYRDLEHDRPGLGLSAAESHRHALAETKEQVFEDSHQSTIREWLKSLARATHGELGAKPPSGQTAGIGDRAAEPPPRGGSDLGRPGRGHLVVWLRAGAPGAPPSPITMSVAGVEGPAPSMLEGTVRDLGLPVEVHLGTMVIKRNEAGQIWIQTLGTIAVLGGNLSGRDQEYLFAKGTGRTDPADSAEFQAGVDAGAGKLVAEVLAMPVRIP